MLARAVHGGCITPWCARTTRRGKEEIGDAGGRREYRRALSFVGPRAAAALPAPQPPPELRCTCWAPWTVTLACERAASGGLLVPVPGREELLARAIPLCAIRAEGEVTEAHASAIIDSSQRNAGASTSAKLTGFESTAIKLQRHALNTSASSHPTAQLEADNILLSTELAVLKHF
ncbi:hypothetical protein K438DRAFT_2016177 [Mycena galopus ATCC 62051]|nr:hypothetical protein K438DRAFT_2016177 [Mycena galopus ATCC 62051]